jgi:altronate dehydratase
MNISSPGNDLESIAGQVASGCQLIYFTTGNGSVTNFPFVPTIKLVTTTTRFNLLKPDMDMNAGEYMDGTPINDLATRLYDITIDVSNGIRTKGEKAGHSQVSMWRNWTQTDDSNLSELQKHPDLFSGISLLKKDTLLSMQKAPSFTASVGISGKNTVEQIGLVMPTSICSGQIACLIVRDQLNPMLEKGHFKNLGITRFIALPHTEGCGATGGSGEFMYKRTILGHLTHPFVRVCLLLEHGCEKTHNDYMADYMKQNGIPKSQFGWASVQLDGGIEKVTSKVVSWFETKNSESKNLEKKESPLSNLTVAVMSQPTEMFSTETARLIANVVKKLIEDGVNVVIPQSSGILKSTIFINEMDDVCPFSNPVTPTIAYAQKPHDKGLHVMETPSLHWVETVTGLGGSGIELMISFNENKSVNKCDSVPQQCHTFIPMLQVLVDKHAKGDRPGFDIVLKESDQDWSQKIVDSAVAVASQKYLPQQRMDNDFQIARGVLGISV